MFDIWPDFGNHACALVSKDDVLQSVTKQFPARAPNTDVRTANPDSPHGYQDIYNEGYKVKQYANHNSYIHPLS